MTIKEWREANLDCTCNANNVYEFRCTTAHEADLPTDIKAGATAIVDDGTDMQYIKMLRIDNGVATWFKM